MNANEEYFLFNMIVQQMDKNTADISKLFKAQKLLSSKIAKVSVVSVLLTYLVVKLNISVDRKYEKTQEDLRKLTEYFASLEENNINEEKE